MDEPTVLAGHIADLVDLSGLSGDDLITILIDLSHDLTRTVESSCGLEITVHLSGWPVRFRSFGPGVIPGASLRLPLPLLQATAEPGSVVVFYAQARGAFVDLAADLSHALQLPMETGSTVSAGDADGGLAIVLDGDLPPASSVSGWSGLEDFSTINRAVGMLIEEGHLPDQAPAVLRAGAAAAGLTTPGYAARLLAR